MGLAGLWTPAAASSGSAIAILFNWLSRYRKPDGAAMGCSPDAGVTGGVTTSPVLPGRRIGGSSSVTAGAALSAAGATGAGAGAEGAAEEVDVEDEEDDEEFEEDDEDVAVEELPALPLEAPLPDALLDEDVDVPVEDEAFEDDDDVVADDPVLTALLSVTLPDEEREVDGVDADEALPVEGDAPVAKEGDAGVVAGVMDGRGTSGMTA